MSKQIAASILSADFARLGEEVDAVLAAGADMIHFDVMDNHYVPNLTIGPMVCKALRDYGVTAPIDVHLMVKPVDNLIKSFAEAGATSIAIHPEATEHLDSSLQLIKSLGCEAGVAINPATSLDCLDYVVNYLSFVLMMTVNPGFGGQSFIESGISKIEEVSHKLVGTGICIAVDGGVKANNIGKISKAGASRFIVGSGIYNQKDYKQAIKELRAYL